MKQNTKTMIIRANLFRYPMVLLLFLAIGQVLLTGCNKQGRGFALPPGDLKSGKAAFTDYGCHSCHSVADIKWKGKESNPHVELGGKVSRIKTYGELVTSVINPSHKVADDYLQEGKEQTDVSKMRIYNEVLTVQDLVDIVTFLQSEYDVQVPSSHYPTYPPY